jgi:hypothetical protein
MDWLTLMILSIEGTVIFGLVVLLVVLAFKRSQIKKEETLEKNNNSFLSK